MPGDEALRPWRHRRSRCASCAGAHSTCDLVDVEVVAGVLVVVDHDVARCRAACASTADRCSCTSHMLRAWCPGRRVTAPTRGQVVTPAAVTQCRRAAAAVRLDSTRRSSWPGPRLAGAADAPRSCASGRHRLPMSYSSLSYTAADLDDAEVPGCRRRVRPRSCELRIGRRGAVQRERSCCALRTRCQPPNGPLLYSPPPTGHDAWRRCCVHRAAVVGRRASRPPTWTLPVKPRDVRRVVAHRVADAVVECAACRSSCRPSRCSTRGLRAENAGRSTSGRCRRSAWMSSYGVRK